MEDVHAHNASGGPVTSQPTAGQGSGPNMVFAMPPPPSASSTNPFVQAGPTESTGLNSGSQPTYTPGKPKLKNCK
jgi:hypothetical protein